MKYPNEMFKEGVTIQAKVIHVSAEERRLGLSIKQLKEDEERKKPKEFRTGSSDAGQTLGDFFKQAEEASSGEEADSPAVESDAPEKTEE